MLVKAVVNDSPAFGADVRKGDILLRIGVVDIYSDKAFDDALKIYEGETVDVVIYRNGEELEKRIRMPFAK
jgi:S1-C subfamily serine protease